MKKPWLVDVPVRIQIWIRPEFQRKQFNIIKQARPRILFLISDAGRTEKENQLIAESRSIVEDIDWDCEVYKLYEEKNQGMYTLGRKIWDFIFQYVDRCILLEDDIIPSVSFFQYCAELLEKFKDDTRILFINGMNHLGVNEQCDSDYFFAHEGSIWGIALWKRTYEEYNSYRVQSCDNHSYAHYCLEQLAKKKDVKAQRVLQLWEGYSKNANFGNHPPGDEYFLSFIEYLQHKLMIVPTMNMISNIGCDNLSTHSGQLRLMPKKIQKIFNMQTHELGFPLRHPAFVIQDEVYAERVRKLMGIDYFFPRLTRKIEGYCRRFLFLSFKENLHWVFRKITKNQKVER